MVFPHNKVLQVLKISCRRCVRSWMDPDDNAIFCMESNRDWMLLSGANRFGLVSNCVIGKISLAAPLSIDKL